MKNTMGLSEEEQKVYSILMSVLEMYYGKSKLTHRSLKINIYKVHVSIQMYLWVWLLECGPSEHGGNMPTIPSWHKEGWSKKISELGCGGICF